MKYLYCLHADWNIADKEYISSLGIPFLAFDYIHTYDSELANLLVARFSSRKDFYFGKGTVVFEPSEIDDSNSYMLQNYPDISETPFLSEQDDGRDYLRYAFGEICESCNSIPLGEQQRPFTFKKKPKLSKKYPWGSMQGVGGYLFTDHERYKIIHNKWGIGKKEVLIGIKQRVSEDFVQLDIPVSKSKLHFGSSYYGKTFLLDGKGGISDQPKACSACGKCLYVNQTLDFFPSFEENFEFDILMTQEWFGWYRRIVASRPFVDWLAEHRWITFDNNDLVPVRQF